MINALSIDLEYWHSPELVRKHVLEKTDDQIEAAVLPILALLDKYHTKATFFVLGQVADKYPQMVKALCQQGHEVASHGYSHRTLHELGEAEFEQELKQSVALLRSITGKKPTGFRAPSFSLDNSTRWALKILGEQGFKYDSSIFPVRTMLYGVSKAPLHPYRPSLDDVTREDPKGQIIEFPMTVLRLGGINIPIAGGFYLRLLPLWFLKLAMKNVGSNRPAIIYLHPWETYPGTPRLREVPFVSRFATYYGINSALKKMEGLLNSFAFQPIERVLSGWGL